ncbi:MAG: ribosome biogenesis GTP-binding protein YihA/YsxC [Clostridium sp.]|nr:ribosome biogenesis GTP-binding protein YihA/YsxC [Clostridium sp.]
MTIKEAKFAGSAADVQKAPATKMHEYAFIGRSNVGKSSLINMLTKRKGLAMTSATPGKTMLINHFLINDSWYIVDLPGYGYAARSKKDLAKLDAMIRSYILERQQMTNLFLLIDSRLEPQKVDLAFMEWLAENEVPFSIVFTKTDKLGKQEANANVAKYCESLLEQWEELPPIFVTSSQTGAGRDELLGYIDEMNKLPLLEEAPAQKFPTNKKDEDMETKSEKSKAQDEKVQNNAEKNYPGAAVDNSDNEEVTSKEVKQRTCTLDFNPHTEGI